MGSWRKTRSLYCKTQRHQNCCKARSLTTQITTLATSMFFSSNKPASRFTRRAFVCHNEWGKVFFGEQNKILKYCRLKAECILMLISFWQLASESGIGSTSDHMIFVRPILFVRPTSDAILKRGNSHDHFIKPTNPATTYTTAPAYACANPACHQSGDTKHWNSSLAWRSKIHVA